jgi:aryl-alcohol dehydrogenase-like predicted oxidoreductase
LGVHQPSRPRARPAIRIIRKSLDASINVIDAADGDSNGEFEEILGKGVRGPSR